jgi:hypothetical protein
MKRNRKKEKEKRKRKKKKKINNWKRNECWRNGMCDEIKRESFS